MQDVSAKPGADAIENKIAAAAPDSEQLRAYTQRKLAIGAQLRALLDILKKRGSQSRFRRCEELMVTLAEDRFTLAVVGQFKRGKSSLMNAIIGRELLPTGVLPLTSAITILRFGPAERVVVHREGIQFPEIVPVSSLASYVTENGNPGNRRKVKAAVVEVPLQFLRRGLEFVDTPGVGSAIEANTATTYMFLPKCDAVIFVTSVDTPFTEAELDFLSAIREHVRKIFFVVNKIDLLRDQRERDEVFKFIESELRAEMAASQVKIFPLSCRLALEKPAAGKTDGAATSGLPELQETLGTFLSEEKSAVFLTAVTDKSLRIIEEESRDLKLHQRAREMPEAVVQKRLERLRSGWRELATARQKMFEQVRSDLSQCAIESTASRFDELVHGERGKFTRNLQRLIASSGWRLGGDVADHWAKFVSRQLAQVTASWFAEIAPRLKLESRPAAIETARLVEANLSKIPKLAAGTFDLPQLESKSVLPRLRAETFVPETLSPRELTTDVSIGLLMWPTRFTARWLRAALEEETNRLIKIHRAHALALIAASAKKTVDKWADEVDAAASEVEAHMTSAITGEQAGSLTWRQTSSPLANPNWGGAELASIRASLITMLDRDKGGAGPPRQTRPVANFQPAPDTHATYEVAPDLRRLRTAATELRQIDITSDLQTRGCAVCDHVIKAAHDLFAQWQYAIASDEKTRRRFAADLGFCALHAWQLHALSSPLGESIGLAPLVGEVSGLLENMKPELAAAAVRRMLHTSESCRVCLLLGEIELDYIERLNAFLADEDNRKLYERSQGVCLRHLGRLIAMTPETIRAFLLAKASRQFGEIAEDMQSYAIKRDAIRRHLTNANEDDAYMRALIHLAGAKNYCTPWPDDREI
jgi:GTPase Era involved in 16S rRNA processing